MTKTSLKKLWLSVAVIVGLLPIGVLAFNQNENSTLVKLEASNAIDGNYYAVAKNIVIDGNITGDLLCAGETVSVTGNVDGDIICAAGVIEIAGNVGGSVRLLSGNASIHGQVGRNITAVASQLYLSPKSQLSMDLVFLTDKTTILGKVEGAVHGAASQVFIGGKIAENVNLVFTADHSKKGYAPLVIQSPALISGDLTYEAAGDAKLAKRENIAGRLIKKTAEGFDLEGSFWQSVGKLWLISRLAAIIAALVIGFCIIFFFKQSSTNLSDKMIDAPGKKILWGALVTALTPLLIFFLCLTIVGLPIALILFCLWLAAVMLAKPVAAIMVGHIIMGRYKHKVKGKKRPAPDNPMAAMAVGVIVLYSLMSIPVFGQLLAYVVSAWGIGGVWLSLQEYYHKKQV